MLSIEKCRQLLSDYELSDDELVKIRDALYQLARTFVAEHRRASSRVILNGKGNHHEAPS